MANVGDVLEIGGRLDDVASDKQGCATLEPAITMSVAENIAAHGGRALTSEEFEARFGNLPSDGEG